MPTGREYAERAVRLALEVGQGPRWTRWAEKWLEGAVTPEKVLWPNTSNEDYKSHPCHECLTSGDLRGMVGYHAFCAARAAFVPGQARYHLEQAEKIAGQNALQPVTLRS